MKLTGLDLFLWVASFLCNVTLLLVLWLKRRAVKFPFFTILIALAVVRTVAVFFVYRFASKDAYFYTYWSIAIVEVAAEFAVLSEAASKIFCPTGSWAPDVKKSFLWMAGIGVAVAAGLTWLATPEVKYFRQVVMVKGNFFSSVLESELFVGIVVLSVTSGLPLRTHVARIVQGLGGFAIAGFLIGGMQTYFGLGASKGENLFKALSQVQNALYVVCAGFWAVTLQRDAPQPRALPERLNRQLQHLNRRAAFALSHLRVGRRT